VCRWSPSKLLTSGGVGCRFRIGVRFGLGRIESFAGDGEEHLVEAGAAQSHVVDFDVALVEQSNDVAQLFPATFDAGRDALRVDVGEGRLTADLRARLPAR